MRRLVPLLLLVSACKCGESASAPDGGSAGTTAARAPQQGVIGPDARLDGGDDSNVVRGPAFVQRQAPPPCAPHVDGSDPEHKLVPVESVYRRTQVDGKDTLDILLLDFPGACEFETRKPAIYRALRVRLQSGLEPGKHFVIGEKTSELTFLAPPSDAGPAVDTATSGIIDLMDVKDDAIQVGFSVKTPTGESFGCFIAKPCK